jgi:hypothetical protein
MVIRIDERCLPGRSVLNRLLIDILIKYPISLSMISGLHCLEVTDPKMTVSRSHKTKAGAKVADRCYSSWRFENHAQRKPGFPIKHSRRRAAEASWGEPLRTGGEQHSIPPHKGSQSARADIARGPIGCCGCYHRVSAFSSGLAEPRMKAMVALG